MIRAKIHLKSGATITVHAEKFTQKNSADGSLTMFQAVQSNDYPLYLRLDDVSAIVTEKRTRFGWRQF
jgi:hypothetical protein